MCEHCKEYEGKFNFCPMCGAMILKLEPIKVGSVKFKHIFEYLKSLDKESTYDEWRYAWQVLNKFKKSGKDAMDPKYLEDIIKEVEKEFKKK